jgi:hypothetical protein
MSSTAGQTIELKRWEKLAAIAGMLGSEHDGERAAAARIATAELQALGLTWRDLVERAQRSTTKVGGAYTDPFQWRTSPQQNSYQNGAWQNADWAQRANAQAYNRTPPKPRTNTHRGIKLWDLVRYALARTEDLTAFETKFIEAKHAIGSRVNATEAEWRVLIQIAVKLGVPVKTEA